MKARRVFQNRNFEEMTSHFFEALILKLYGLIRTKIVTEINPIFCNCSLKQTRGLLTNIRNVVPLNKSENTNDSNFPAVTFSAE